MFDSKMSICSNAKWFCNITKRSFICLVVVDSIKTLALISILELLCISDLVLRLNCLGIVVQEVLEVERWRDGSRGNYLPGSVNGTQTRCFASGILSKCQYNSTRYTTVKKLHELLCSDNSIVDLDSRHLLDDLLYHTWHNWLYIFLKMATVGSMPIKLAVEVHIGSGTYARTGVSKVKRRAGVSYSTPSAFFFRLDTVFTFNFWSSANIFYSEYTIRSLEKAIHLHCLSVLWVQHETWAPYIAGRPSILSGDKLLGSYLPIG